MASTGASRHALMRRMLATDLKEDNIGTFSSPNALECALWWEQMPVLDEASGRRGRRPHSLKWLPPPATLLEVLRRLALYLTLHVLWTIRAIIVPVMCGVGTAMSFATTQDLKSIVLDSIAIAFVCALSPPSAFLPLSAAPYAASLLICRDCRLLAGSRSTSLPLSASCRANGANGLSTPARPRSSLSPPPKRSWHVCSGSCTPRTSA